MNKANTTRVIGEAVAFALEQAESDGDRSEMAQSFAATLELRNLGVWPPLETYASRETPPRGVVNL